MPDRLQLQSVPPALETSRSHQTIFEVKRGAMTGTIEYSTRSRPSLIGENTTLKPSLPPVVYVRLVGFHPETRSGFKF